MKSSAKENGNKTILKDNWENHPHFKYLEQKKVTRKEVRQFLKPFVINADNMPLVWKSAFLLASAKGLGIVSPYILKIVVDAMTMASSIDF